MTNQIDIIQEVQQNFIDSSYDVNTNRAFPDVRDGLKPGQRACIWEMYKKGYTSKKPHVKSAKIDGGVAALWWPHGTTAIYETFARMSQPFTNNIPEVDFHGANGNVILGGDAIAADRYTEARLAGIAEDGMLRGIEKNNVDMIWNFSEDEQWPKVLPAIFPRLLVNGCQGIGVSVANTFLPHNFTETADMILSYLASGELDTSNYYPDFPTGGTIINKDELDSINKTGKGRVIVQAKYSIEGQEISFTEMPYQIYIEPVIEKIKEKIDSGELAGIDDVINKSDKKRLLLVVKCQKGYDSKKVLSDLFNLTPLQSQYNANQFGIISKTPILLNTKELIDAYIIHNLKCIKREFQFDLNKTQNRIEILEGLITALTSIDSIVETIKESENPTVAKSALVETYSLTDNQAQAILDMKLSRLTKLDGVKLNEELQEKKEYANRCAAIVSADKEQKSVLIERLTELKNKYGDKRRTQVIQKTIEKKTKNGATKQPKPVEDVVITHNAVGYLERIPVSLYRNNNHKAIKTTTEDLILLFTNFGRLFRVSPNDIKTCGVKDKGTAIGAIVKLQPGEKVINMFSTTIDEKRPYLTFVLNSGIIKKIEKAEYLGNTRNLSGMIATKVSDGMVISVQETNGNDIVLCTKNNMAIRFNMEEVRPSGRNSLGVKGINLAEGDEIVDVIICNPDAVAVAGMTLPKQKRGGKGKHVAKR